MEEYLVISQAVFSILFMLSVLLQEKGSSMSLTFGGTGEGTFYGSKQGLDKFLAYSSYIFGALFVLNAIAYVVVSNMYTA